MLIIKEKIDKLHYIEIKNFWPSKDTTKKTKRQVTEWKRYWQCIHSTKNLLQLQINFSKNKKQTTQWKKYGQMTHKRIYLNNLYGYKDVFNFISHQRNANQTDK